jgi:hypothetical protein
MQSQGQNEGQNEVSTQHENVTSSRNMKMSPPDPTDISS